MMKTSAAEVCLDKPQPARVASGEFLGSLVQTLARLRCQWIHRSISRPVGGKYRCWTCLREFPTDW